MPDPNEDLLAQRLRAAREGVGLSQDEVGDRVGLGRQALSDIERGRRRVTASELFALARVYGRPAEWFLAGAGVGAEEEGAVFLRATSLSLAGAEVLRSFLLRCREYGELERLVGEMPPPFWRAQAPVTQYEDCWALAHEERRRLGMGESAGSAIQEALEERLRVKVLFERAPDEISGASVLSRHFGPAILVNRDHPDGRRVWSLAHEYFHLLTFGRVVPRPRPAADAVRESGAGLEGGRGNEAGEPIRACGAAKAGGRKPKEEQFADQFAAAFLLPEEPVRERVRAVVRDGQVVRWEELCRVAIYFRVSTEALLWRLANLGILGKNVPTAYRESPEGPALDRRVREALGEPEPRSRRLEALAVELYLREEISAGRLAEVLGRDRGDVEQIVRGYRPPSEDVDEFPYRPS